MVLCKETETSSPVYSEHIHTRSIPEDYDSNSPFVAPKGGTALPHPLPRAKANALRFASKVVQPENIAVSLTACIVSNAYHPLNSIH